MVVALFLLGPTRAPGQAVVWQLTVPPPLILLESRAAPTLVTVLADSVTTLRIVHSTLREATTGALLLSDQVALCARPEQGCTTPRTLPKGSHQLYLVVSDSFRSNGEFKGMLYLQVDQKPEPTAIELTLYGSTGWSQMWGVVLVTVGVVISIFSTAYLRQFSSRLDALAPAALLATYLDDLDSRIQQTISATEVMFPKARARITGLRKDLAEATLDAKGYLPGRLRNPFGVGEADAAAYRSYLSDRSDQIAAVRAVVSHGLDAVDKAWKVGPGHQAIRTASDELDELAGSAKVPAEVPPEVAQIIAKMDAAMQPRQAQGAPQPAGQPKAAIRSILDIRSQQVRVALASWCLLAIVTVVAGVAILVLGNHGFGTPLDYVKSFFWGLGVQTAGQQFQQLTQGGIASSLKLSLPA